MKWKTPKKYHLCSRSFGIRFSDSGVGIYSPLLFSATRNTWLKKLEKETYYCKLFIISFVSSTFDFWTHNFSKSSYPFISNFIGLCDIDPSHYQESGFFLFFPMIEFYTVMYNNYNSILGSKNDMEVPNP